MNTPAPLQGPSSSRLAVTLNGESVRLPNGTTLAGLLRLRGVDPASVATAVNAEFVPRTMRDSTRLSGNDAVTTFQAIVGG
ncbi:MAG: sulfur carrier protein ThiS [Burkholderiaceae bacterium]|nr:sulfur carrier protein ThiS [Burkholderiaceae bacterium]